MSKIKSAILSVIGPKLSSPGRIVSTHSVTEHFRMIDIESDSLRDSSWKPGGKVQINTGGWLMRTYTPVSIDAGKAQIRILAFLPGFGPGSAWASSVKSGDSLNFIGPDSSLELSKSEKPILLFGDETSFGLAVGLNRSSENKRPVSFVFEVSSPQESSTALGSLGIGTAKLFGKNNGLTVPTELIESIGLIRGDLRDYEIVLSGCAQSIQVLRSRLKTLGVSGSQMKTKAYWSQGKTGLD